jgi:toxin ParE1/3/4
MPRARRRRVIWSPEADKDLLDIWAYYARVASPEIADNLLREIDRIGDGIGENPLLSRQRDDLLPGLRSFIVRPHVIFFRIGDGAVEVVRVLHGRRDFPTIFGREGR